jgi:arsenate reductase (glutaredoxin)
MPRLSHPKLSQNSAMTHSITLYGISNCDTVKKSRTWFEAQGKTYRFHDLKKEGVSPELLRQWLKQVDWRILVNTKGTTWRQLSEAQKSAVKDADSAMALMLEHCSVIKRPVVSQGERLTVGYVPEKWQEAEQGDGARL